jgi:hypothetical protein
LFFVTCLTLAYLGGKKTVATSVVDRVPVSSASSSASNETLQIPATPVEAPGGTEPASK